MAVSLVLSRAAVLVSGAAQARKDSRQSAPLTAGGLPVSLIIGDARKGQRAAFPAALPACPVANKIESSLGYLSFKKGRGLRRKWLRGGVFGFTLMSSIAYLLSDLVTVSDDGVGRCGLRES